MVGGSAVRFAAHVELGLVLRAAPVCFVAMESVERFLQCVWAAQREAGAWVFTLAVER